MSLLSNRVELSAAYPLITGRDWRATQAAHTAILAGGAATAVALASMIAFTGAKVATLMIVVLLLITLIAVRPAVAGYLLIAVTPLVAGIDRGTALPALRPNEALMVLAAAALCGRAVVRLSISAPRPRILPLDAAILLLAVTSSIVPLAWLAVRGVQIESDDVLYALMIWKYYAVFLIFRSAIRAPAQARICLWLAMTAAALVAIIAILQSLELFGVDALLATYYAPYGDVSAVSINRGGSTLSLPIAVADLMIFNLAIAIGMLKTSRLRWLLLSLASLFAIGVFASGQFSGLIALLVGTGAVAIATGRIRYFVVLPVSLAAAAVALRPVIDRRLEGFQSPSGLPVSWQGRISNLENYFLPQLFSHEQWLLGVRPAARVATQKMATGYIWIESGYVWLLWAGGLPLLASFLYFLRAGGREAMAVVRTRTDAFGAAALAVVTGLSVVGVLMIIDPHLTYRGSADLLFALLGITAAARTIRTDELPVERDTEEQDADAALVRDDSSWFARQLEGWRPEEPGIYRFVGGVREEVGVGSAVEEPKVKPAAAADAPLKRANSASQHDDDPLKRKAPVVESDILKTKGERVRVDKQRFTSAEATVLKEKLVGGVERETRRHRSSN